MHRLPASTTSVFRNHSAPSRATIITAALNGKWRLFLAQCYLHTVACGLDIFFRPGRGAEYCDQPVCLCLSVCEHVSGTAGPIGTKFGVQIPCGHASVFLLQLCATLCTSGFTDDITFGCSVHGLSVAKYSAPYGVVRLGQSLMSMSVLFVLHLLDASIVAVDDPGPGQSDCR